MAKETKAEREVRLQAEQNERWAEFVAEYPARFANVMYLFMNNSHAGFTVKRFDYDTYEFGRHDHMWAVYTLKTTPPQNYSLDVMDALENLESEFKAFKAEEAEAQRKYEVRQAALAKLNKEERDLLGL